MYNPDEIEANRDELHIPRVASIRGNDIERAPFNPGKISHVMFALQNASALTTNASVLREKVKAFIDCEINLIPNGVDSDLFRPMHRNSALVEALDLENDDKSSAL